MHFLRLVIILALQLLSIAVLGQHILKGKVLDKKTKSPLAFVNIVINQNQRSVGVTDIDGKFLINSTDEIKTVTFTYLGYENYILPLNSSKAQESQLIELSPSVFELQEVIVKASENAANRIIKKVIENRDINNPENISSFTYTAYNKNIFDFVPSDSLGSNYIKKRLDSVFQGGHMFMTETVSERKFIAPNTSEETVLGTKASGLQHPTFAALATDLQPFSFYKDVIEILDAKYLNPISDGSLRKYWFNIEDTLFQNQDTVFIISFIPQKGKNFDGLTGLLYINSNGYAIQNVIAEPFDKGLIDIKIQQQYGFIDNKKWFPLQLNFQMIMLRYPSKKLGTCINGRSYITDVKLYPTLNKANFSLETVKMDEHASEKDSLFWVKYRPETLDIKEKQTYHVIDSIGKKNNFDKAFTVLERISLNKIPIKCFDIDIPKTLIYNQFEGFRLGSGVYTNDKISKLISVGGFFGYGTKDHQWKYGEELILNLSKYHEFEIRARNQNTLRETGGTALNTFSLNYFDYRSYLTYQMDRIHQNAISISIRALKYAKLNAAFSNTFVIPQYNYSFMVDGKQLTNFTYSDITLNLKYAYKEKLINSFGGRISLGTKYPTFYTSYTRGVKGVYGSEFNFNKVEVRIEQSVLFKNLGETKLRVDAGYIDSPLPYSLLFTGQGSYSTSQPLLMKNYFQTMNLYEFLSDRYAAVFISHNFGSLLLKTNTFKPAISIHQNMGWGTLSNKATQQLIAYKTMEKGYYESGIQVDNIIRLNYLNIFYLGFGAGAYYRYGDYAYADYKNNTALKFSMTLTTR